MKKQLKTKINNKRDSKNQFFFTFLTKSKIFMLSFFPLDEKQDFFSYITFF
jgi:hypothetical protein